MKPQIDEQDIIKAAGEGMDAFVMLFADKTLEMIGGSLTAENMGELSGAQTTLLAYIMYRTEVMDGGHVQLIYNGLGGFIFHNPFARAMREWGAKEFSKLLYEGRKLFDTYGEAIQEPCSDEAFMARFEQYEEFDALDDGFVEMEEEVTAIVASYIDEHLDEFATIVK